MLVDQIKALKEQRGDCILQAEAIASLAEEANRNLTAEEMSRIENLTKTQVSALDQQIAILERTEALKGSSSSTASAAGATWTATASFKQAEAKKDPSIKVQARRLSAFKNVDDAKIAANWFAAANFGHEGARQFCEAKGIDYRTERFRNALTTTDNSKGGFFVPEQMEAAIIDLKEEYGVFARKARRAVMSSDSYLVNRRKSGLTAYYIGENPSAGITESDIAFDQVRMTARKLATLVPFSTEINEESVVDLIDRLTMETAYAFSVAEDAAGFNGDGTSTYGGITGLKNALLAGSKVTAVAGNTSFGALDMADFESMIGKLPSFPGIRPEWYIHKAGWAASMQRLANAAGGNTIENIVSGVPMTSFLGYPVNFVTSMNSTLDTQASADGLCYFGDLAMAATYGIRRGITISFSEHVNFTKDMNLMKATQRHDILVHETGTASVAGPMIMLSTPAS